MAEMASSLGLKQIYIRMDDKIPKMTACVLMYILAG